MAHPKWHALPTFVLVGIYVLLVAPFALLSREVFIAILTIGLGIFMDADHVSVRRIKKILRGEKGPVPGWVNYMHTWQAFLGVVLLCAILGNFLPLSSFAIHIAIDGGDRSNVKYHGAAPLPEFLHRFYPERLKYQTKLMI